MTNEQRAAWLEGRRRGIGGSDVAAVLGLNPWKTPLDVWNDKLGLSEDKGMSEPAVHPRLRGELSMARPDVCRHAGSSPLTRGTQLAFNTERNNARFIPAYAGNSLKQGIEHLTNSSKDFLSGKYAKNPETVLNHFKNSSLD